MYLLLCLVILGTPTASWGSQLKPGLATYLWVHHSVTGAEFGCDVIQENKHHERQKILTESTQLPLITLIPSRTRSINPVLQNNNLKE